MAFSETEKLSTLKQKMKDAIDQGSTWDAIKAEFLTMPSDFKDEVIDFLGAEKDRGNAKIVEWTDYVTNVDDLIGELVGG